MQHYQVFISAENTKQANKILDHLLKKKLILGGPVLEGPAKFWWKGRVVRMNYAYIFTYTIKAFKQKIIKECKVVSAEEIPMISFTPLEGNSELIKLIDETLV